MLTSVQCGYCMHRPTCEVMPKIKKKPLHWHSFDRDIHLLQIRNG